MAFSSAAVAAVGRLASYYNGGLYGSANLGGFDNDGHRVNFVPCLQDVALVAQETSALIQQAGLDQGQGVAASLAARLRLDAAGSYTSTQIVQGLANLGIDAAETSVASAATTDIGASLTQFVLVTGTTTITSFGTGAKRVRLVRFDNSLTLTHNATSLILPGAQNIGTLAGDTLIATLDASGNWRVRFFQRANSLAAGILSFRNRIINGNFTINQRGIPASNQSYAAGVYLLDRWKAASSGTVFSFTTAANGDVTASSTAGFLQIIEGALYLPEGGTYTLSWTGTAGARVYQGGTPGAFVNSPVTVTGLTAGTNTTIEFSPGTVSLAQFEPGNVATVFERQDERARCSRYYRVLGALVGSWGASTSTATVGGSLDIPMRSAPTVILVNGGVNNGSALEPSVAQRRINSIGATTTSPSGIRIDLNTDAESTAFRTVIVETGALALSAEL